MNFLKSKIYKETLWGIFIALAIIIGLTTYLVNQYITKYVYDNYVASLKNEADSFELALQEDLIQHDFNLVQLLLTDLGLQKSINSIRLLNSEGVVRASSNAAEVGIQLERTSLPCIACHTASSENPPFQQLNPRKGEEESTILIANPLNNRVVCQSCHKDGKPTRGILLVDFHAEDLINRQKYFTIGVYSG